MVYDFEADVLRPATPKDRLHLHVKRPYVPPSASLGTVELVSRFVTLLREWTLKGPGLINCDREDAGQHQSVELRRLFFELLTKRDELPLLHALSRQWVRGSNDDGEHVDELVFLLKHLPRAFSRTDRYTGMLNITGAEGSGKGTFIFLLKCFGGETDDNLGHAGSQLPVRVTQKKSQGFRGVLTSASRCSKQGVFVL